MPQEVPETFGPEAFRLYARQVVKLELDDNALEALRQGVNGLLAELSPLDAVGLGGVEPATGFAIGPEGWTR